MAKIIIRIANFVGMAIILTSLIIGNVFAGIYFDIITVYLLGSGIDFSAVDFSNGDQIVQEIATEGIVMLENNGTLPIEAGNINVFGWGATDGGFLTSGSGSGSSSERQDEGKLRLLLQGLEEGGFAYNETLIKMYEKFKNKREGTSLHSNEETFFCLYEPSIQAYTSAIMDEAEAFSDTALVVISRLGGEGKDLPKVQYKSANSGQTAGSTSTDNTRTYLQISTDEQAMLELVASTFDKVVLILNTCNAMQLDFVDTIPGIDAVLSVGALGQSGALAIPKILDGTINPSGRTVDTYAYDHRADPTFLTATGRSYSNGGVYIDYSEGIYSGYRYYETAGADGFIDYDTAVQYPFGYGLSYTSFSWRSERVGSSITKNGKIEVKVTVTNTGNVDGKDVVQVYFTAPYIHGGIEKAHVQLAAFAKTSLLQPNEWEDITLTFDVFDMASYDAYDANNNGFAGYELDPGKYEVKVMRDAHTVVSKFDYTLSSGIQYDVDPVTGYPIENLFTGDSAYAGIAIDGGLTENITYLSRADYAGTFPQATAQRSLASSIASKADTFTTNKSDSTQSFTQGSGGSLRLTYDDGGILVYDEQLIQELGMDFDNPLWEQLLDQLTYNELANLVGRAGYMTYEAPSIGKPACNDFDGPSGLNNTNMSQVETAWSGYPVETVIASTWNAPLAYIMGLAVGYEASVTNVSGWYAPAVNIHRSPYAGRNFEYYSEDAYLSGVMGAETTLGATSNGLYAYVKHFAVNDSENAREGLYTWLTEQALREVYLRPFEICVKDAEANAIMSSFNRLGAIWTGANHSLLTTILRDEWGFRGSVVTDYYNREPLMGVDRGLRAGNDCWLNPTNSLPPSLTMPSGSNTTQTAVARNAAKNMLYTYTNTIARQMNYSPTDDRFVTEGGVKTRQLPEPIWVWGVVALDAVVVIGIGTWIYFLLFFKRKKKAVVTN